MEKKKEILRPTFSQWRRIKQLGVTIGKGNRYTNFFTMEEKKATGTNNKKRLS